MVFEHFWTKVTKRNSCNSWLHHYVHHYKLVYWLWRHYWSLANIFMCNKQSLDVYSEENNYTVNDRLSAQCSINRPLYWKSVVTSLHRPKIKNYITEGEKIIKIKQASRALNRSFTVFKLYINVHSIVDFWTS